VRFGSELRARSLTVCWKPGFKNETCTPDPALTENNDGAKKSINERKVVKDVKTLDQNSELTFHKLRARGEGRIDKIEIFLREFSYARFFQH